MSEEGEKKLVTHYNPDLDAVCSIWLIVRWLAGWERAEFEIVPAGETYQGEEVDANPDILHVDTGLGKLDHHQTEEYTCAAKKTLEYVRERPERRDKVKFEREKLEWNAEALERLVEVVNRVDHFQEVYYPDPEADLYQFTAEAILDGWKLIYREQDKLVIAKGLEVLDAVYISLLSKIEAENVLTTEGLTFPTRWGEGIAIETKNSEVVSLAQKRGFKVTVLKHPTTGHVKIKTPPVNFIGEDREAIDLTEVYRRLKEQDPAATWFLHSSKTMVLNGSAKNPKMKATKLSLAEVVNIIENL